MVNADPLLKRVCFFILGGRRGRKKKKRKEKHFFTKLRAFTASTYYWLLLMVEFQGIFLHRRTLASMATGIDSHEQKPGLVNPSAMPQKETHQ